MAVVARIRWTTPQPTVVDEELLVSDDGSAVLVVRTSRRQAPVVGSFRTEVDDTELATLDGADLAVDLLHLADGSRDDAAYDAALVATAGRVAARADQPVAVLTFGAAALPDGRVVLLAVGGGSEAAEAELDPDAVTIHLEQADGAEVRWVPAPTLVTGFASPDAVHLGGVRTPTRIDAGKHGGIVVGEVTAGEGATHVAVGLAGTLRDPVAGSRDVRGFRVRTAAVPLGTGVTPA